MRMDCVARMIRKQKKAMKTGARYALVSDVDGPMTIIEKRIDLRKG